MTLFGSKAEDKQPITAYYMVQFAGSTTARIVHRLPSSFGMKGITYPSMSSLAQPCPCKHGRGFAPFVNKTAIICGLFSFLKSTEFFYFCQVGIGKKFTTNQHEPTRLEYHTARLFVGQDIHGKDKKYNDLKETYQIAILAKERFFPDENLAHNFLYYDPNAHISLGGKTRIITVELVKTEPAAGKPIEEMTNAELWAVFFQYLTDEGKRDKIIEIINREEGIAMALETLSNITQDEIEYARLCNLIKSELDYQDGMATAKHEGRSEAILEIARKMKSMGLLTEQIQAATSLSSEIIAQL